MLYPPLLPARQLVRKGRYDTILAGAGDSENVTLQIILRPLLLPFRRSTASARRIRQCRPSSNIQSRTALLGYDRWAKDQKIVYRTINARAETVDKAGPTGRHSASAAACYNGPRT
jgi:hypothetical protein